MLDNLPGVINRRFGSKRGLLNHAASLAQWVGGRYSSLSRLDFERVHRLVFVCSGNICRSPLAAEVATREGCSVASFGLDCTPGMPADPRMIATATACGYSLAMHRTRRAEDVPIGRNDLLIAMEPRHLLRLEPLRGSAQVTLLGLWHGWPRPYIHDPYSAGSEYFESCARVVVTSTRNLLARCPMARVAHPPEQQDA